MLLIVTYCNYIIYQYLSNMHCCLCNFIILYHTLSTLHPNFTALLRRCPAQLEGNDDGMDRVDVFSGVEPGTELLQHVRSKMINARKS